MAEDRPNYFDCRFVVELPPIRTTHQSEARILKTKDGRMFVGKMANSKVKAWTKQFADVAGRYVPDKPFDGPLELTMYFGFPNIQSDKGKTMPMTTKPDFDNLSKSVCDEMTKMGFWHDDSQVVFGKVMKFRTQHPFVAIHVRPCEWMNDDYSDTTRTQMRNTKDA